MICSSHNHQTDGCSPGTSYCGHRPADHYPQRDSAGSPGGGLFDANSKVTGWGLTGSGPFGRPDCPVPPRARRALHLSFNSRLPLLARRRSAGGLSSLTILPVATLIRRSAFVAARQFQAFCSPHHFACQGADAAKNHRHTPSSAVRYPTKVARDEKHDVHKIRASGASHEC